MKKLFYLRKKGFTLIELLAVIVILAIILLIAFPVVLNVISEAKKGAFESSAYGLSKTSENECMANIVKGDNKIMEVVFEDGVITSDDMISFTGRAPKEGVIIINKNCKVQMAISDGYWCVQKAFNNKEVTITRLSDMTEDCEITDFAGLIEWVLQGNGKITAILPSVSGPNVEYSKDGTNWQSSRTFTELEPGTSYTFRVRIDGVETEDLITITSPNVYTVTYQAATGGSVDPLSRNVLEDEIALGPNVTENSGYDFTNFTIIAGSENGDLNLSNGNVSNVVGNMTIQANFTIRQYTVNYQSNQGATFDPNYRTVPHGSDATIPTVEIEEGYTFSHYTVINGVGNGDLDTETGNVTNVIGNMVIEASFTLNEYTVTYTASTGGSVSTPSRVVTHGGTSVAPGHSANTGYTFTNFEITSGGGNGDLNTSTGAVTNVIGHMTVRANFTINSYTITYTASTGGSVSPSSESVNWGTASTGTVATPSTGYTFTNFTIESGSCNGTFNNGTGICSDVRSTMTIRANFTINTYTVTYIASTGGSITEPASGFRTVNHGSNSSAPTYSTNSGYSFSNFERTSGSGGSLNTTTGAVTSVTGNQTIRANFTISSYTVTYDANGGSCTLTSESVNPGSSAASPMPCTRSGYNLTGFTRTANPSNCASGWDEETGYCGSVIGNITIRADWTSGACGELTSVSWQGVNYSVIGIGTQCWFAENLRATHNGCLSNTWDSSSPYNACAVGGGTFWNQNEVYYQWGAAMNGSTTEGAQGLCPTGWKVPTDGEWTTLTNYVNSVPEYRCNDTDTWIAKALASTDRWSNRTNTCAVGNNQSTNNATGFNLKAAGHRGPSGSVSNLGALGYWWSSSLSNTSVWEYNLNSGNEGPVARDKVAQVNGFSVRCLLGP